MHDIVDFERYPLDKPDSAELRALIADCREKLSDQGSFNLDGFMHSPALARAVTELEPLCTHEAFTHQRSHNVYFSDRVNGVAADHAALTRFDTVNHTVCGDQLEGTLVHTLYKWPPLRAFLAAVMQTPVLFTMDDALAGINVIEYRPGETLNWHFDRSQYTTTLLLQAAESGGEFEYRSGLRSENDANYDGVARALKGDDRHIRINALSAGTLNVFAGRNTLHRVSAVRGRVNRMVAVLSYYDKPGVRFSAEELIGFYGRSE